MENIEAILKLRKEYVLKLYDFFNSVHPSIFPVRQEIKHKTDAIIKEENQSFSQWQSKVDKLNRFNNEITTWINKNQGKALDDKKRSEIDYLKNSFNQQIETSKSHYLLTFDIITKSRKKWMAELSYDFLQASGSNVEINKLHREVANTYSELFDYCNNWKSKTIEKIQHLVRASYEIEQICYQIKELIETMRLNMNDEFLPIDEEAKKYPEKTFQISELCESLSQKLEKFMVEQDLYAVLNKINVEEQDFKKEFLEIFGTTGFNSIRTTIRLVNKISATEKKVLMIMGYFKKIQLALQPELSRITSKKNKLLALCTDASELGRLTIVKWIEFNYKDIFTTLDELIRQRSPLLPPDLHADDD